MRLPASILLLFLLLTGCTAVDRLTKRDRATDEESLPELAENEAGVLTEAPPAPTDSPSVAPAPAPPPGGGVVLPRSARQPAANNPGARPRVPGPVGNEQSDTAANPDTYASSPAAPRPYGQTEAPYNSADHQPAAAASATAAVKPNTTLVNTPEHYEHVTAVPQLAVKAPFAAALTGLWTNVDDPDEIVEFTPTHYTTFYQDSRIIQEAMTVHPRCPGDCTEGVPTDQACLTVTGPAGIDCFAILRLSATEMELRLLGISEETVTYRRK